VRVLSGARALSHGTSARMSLTADTPWAFTHNEARFQEEDVAATFFRQKRPKTLLVEVGMTYRASRGFAAQQTRNNDGDLTK